MNKCDFLTALRARLSGLPDADIERSLDYYGEMIDDRMEDGLTEEDAVAAIGTPEEIAAQICREMPLGKLVKARVQKTRTLNAGKIVLLILGAPLWIALLIAAAAILFALYAVIWSVVIVLYAAEFSLIVCALTGIVFSVLFFMQGHPWAAIALLGFSLMLAGLCIGLFFGCYYAAVGSYRCGQWILQKIKSAFIKKEAE